MNDDWKNFTPRTNAPLAAAPALPSAKPLSSSRSLRSTEEMREQAASLTDLSIEALESVIRHGDKDSDRIAAAIALLDRGHGKPQQQLTIRSNAGKTIDAVYNEIYAIKGDNLKD